MFPIIGIVLLLSFTIAPLSPSILLLFLFGAVLLVVGMMFFTLGVELAMTPMGERVGTKMARSMKLWVVCLLCFLLGVIITISEPDLQVLAEQVPSIPNVALILAVAFGVGFFLVAAMMRMLFSRSLAWTVFCSRISRIYEGDPVVVISDCGLFAAFQIFSLKLKKKTLLKIVVGIVYTYVGLVLFLTGVNVGFMPGGNHLGQTIAALPYRWILIPIGMIIGYFIVKAEPAVYILMEQVEEITSGAISGQSMGQSFCPLPWVHARPSAEIS